MREAKSAASVQRAVAICGALNLLALGALALGSTWLNLVKPLSVPDGRIAFYRRVAEALPLLRSLPPAEVAVRADLFLLGYLLPIAASTLLAAVVFVGLRRRRDVLDAATPARVLHFAAGFAVVSALSLPILADDFFVSLVWGRMVRAASNPYYLPMDPVFALGTPLELRVWPHRMSYGPLWAAISGGVMALARGDLLLGAVLLKGLVAGAWVASLFLIRSILSNRSPWQQSLALLLAGWLPLLPVLIVGDGRNDAFVVLGVLLWLRERQRGRAAPAAVALAASVAIKYATAALFLVDLAYHLRGLRRPLLAYAAPAGAALITLAVTFAPFHAGWDLWSYVSRSELLRIHFFTPREAVIALEVWSGVSLGPLPALARLVFPGIAVAAIARYARRPDDRSLHLACLAVLCAMIFGVSNLLPPWYLSWLLPLAALEPGALLSRWALAAALTAPLMVMPANAFPELGGFVRGHAAALVWYAAVLALALALGRPLAAERAR